MPWEEKRRTRKKMFMKTVMEQLSSKPNRIELHIDSYGNKIAKKILEKKNDVEKWNENKTIRLK